MLLPVSVSFHKKFKPLSNTPATSLVENLSHGRHANILVLGDGDPRKILYTLYSEEDNGKAGKVMTLMSRIPEDVRRDILRCGTRCARYSPLKMKILISSA